MNIFDRHCLVEEFGDEQVGKIGIHATRQPAQRNVLFSHRGTDPAAAFLHHLTENHDLSETEFLVDGYGYLTALAPLGLSSHLNYSRRNHIKKWFHVLKMRTDRFNTSWMGSQSAVKEWLQQFSRYYNRFRPHQALDEQPPAKLIQTVASL